MKKLPIGIQNIRDIITKEYIYIDKTQFALDLINNGKHYFLSRPRRFGRSLFLDTLKEIFKGNKALLGGCHIAQSNYDWQPYPVLSFNFSTMASRTTESLKNDFKAKIANRGEKRGIDVEGLSLELQLDALIKSLSQKGPVVVLIDEYDHPIISHLHNPEVAEGNRKLLQTFFGVLQNLDKHLKFTFIAGVSRFSKIALGSQVNHLKDISMDTKYAAIAGYTQEEIVQYCDEHVQAITQNKNEHRQPCTKEEVLAEIKDWYNGYRFSKAETYVHNPFSTLNYLDERHLQNYWYVTGTPSFLIKQLHHYPSSAVPLSGTKAEEDELIHYGNLEKINIKALMFQTGYFTIKGYDADSNNYQLGFPNKEVQKAFTESLVRHFDLLDGTLPNERSFFGKISGSIF